MIGDFLYQLTARDGAQPLLEAHIEQFSGQLANVAVSVDHAVEDGYAWLIQNLVIEAQPSHVTTLVRGLRAWLMPPGKLYAGSARLLEMTYDGNAGLAGSGNLVGTDASTNGKQLISSPFNFLLVPPGWTMRVEATFSNAAGVNIVRAEMCAIRIPRGNIAI